jgi:hypothetical protein
LRSRFLASARSVAAFCLSVRICRLADTDASMSYRGRLSPFRVYRQLRSFSSSKRRTVAQIAVGEFVKEGTFYAFIVWA